MPVIDSSATVHFEPDSRKSEEGRYVAPKFRPHARARAGGVGAGTIWFALSDEGRVLQRRLGEQRRPTQGAGLEQIGFLTLQGHVGEGDLLLADRAYDSGELRRTLAERGAWANIRPMPNRVNIPAFSGWLYRQRNAVERFFNKLKHFRAIATRYDKLAAHFLGFIKLAAIMIWLK